MLRHVAVTLAVVAAIGFALAHADEEQEARLDMEIILSDMPLTPAVKVAEPLEEWQANDIGTVILLIGVEICNGVPL